MAYKFSKGNRGFGDIKFEDDSDTGFDFEDNYIGFDTDGSTSMVLSGSKVGIGTTTPDYRLQVAGNIGVNQYIYHNGDANTWINFTDNRIRLNAGGNNFIDCEDPGSAPHKVRINNGGNNIDFVIKDNSGNVYFTADASTSRIGIGTDTPNESLHVAGNIKASGDDVRIKIDGDTDSHPGLELYENGTRKWIIYNDHSDDKMVFKTDTDQRMVIEQDGKVGIGNNSPSTLLHLEGTDPTITFSESSTEKATIGINSSDNILVENKTMNKHIVFKVNDQGTVKEGLRLDGAVPEVVVNQTSDSLVDFRVESDDNTHMLFVDGSENKIGIGISAPQSTLHVHADSINNGAVRISQSDNSGDASQLDLLKSRGSGASPAAVQSNDFIGQVRFAAYDGNSYDNFVDIYAQASHESISTTSHPSKLIIRTTKVNAISPTIAITIDENQNLISEGNLEAKDTITIRNQNAPASASAVGMRGEIRYDNNYIYICVADDTWKRVALSTW